MTRKKKIDLTDTAFEVTGIQKDFLKNILKEREVADAAFQYASEAIERTRKHFFATVHDFYPEIKPHHWKYNSVTGEVIVLAKKSELKED